MLIASHQVGDFFTCLTCNGKGRELKSIAAVRNHMLDKGHVFIDTSEEGMLELSEYYDYRYVTWFIKCMLMPGARLYMSLWLPTSRKINLNWQHSH